MATSDVGVYSLNSGEVSRLGLARVDLAKLKMACEIEANFLPMVLGPAIFRPGSAFLDHTKSDLASKFIEFYIDEVTKALLVLTPLFMRIMVSDAYIVRGTVTAAVTNGTFTTDLAGWTDSDEAGAASTWAVGGYMQLVGTDNNFAWRDQQVAVAQVGAEHALRIVIFYGNVTVKIGTALGDGTYYDVFLAPGTYSLAFNPTGDFWIRFGNNTLWASYVDSVAVEAAGVVELPAPWDTGDLANILYDQSEDVIFVACKGLQQRRIEHRAALTAGSTDTRSWGVALYLADDGPFRLPNLGPINITPSDVHGGVLLTADRPLFNAGHFGALFRLTHPGQSAFAVLAGANQFTGSIRVSGIGDARGFGVNVYGTFVATVTLQRSLGAPGSWTDVEQYTATTQKSFNDALDNQIIYYRVGIKAADYTSGTVNAQLDYSGSVQTGICRINTVTGTTTATADVLTQFGGITATTNWSEGEWSTYRGWPSAVALHDGGARLFWESGVKIFGSVSDGYASFDDTLTGEAAPISRVIATGGRDGVRWLLSLQRLLAGTASQEISIRADALDGFLTKNAFTARVFASRGAARVRALRVDKAGIYVSRNAKRVFVALLNAAESDYDSHELTRLKQEMCQAGVRSVAVQRQPDTRIWFVLGDGTCAVLTYEPADEVLAWTPISTLGSFEDVAVLPGSDEDQVYFSVKRTIGGSTVRYVEKLAMRSEVVGGAESKTMDSHIVYSSVPTTTISGLAHLEGQQVVVWGDGAPLVTMAAPLTVSGGQITLPDARSNVVVGLPYTGQIKTVKLAYAAERGTALEMQKRIARVGLVMADVAWKGIRIGKDFVNMTGLPATYRGKDLLPWQVLTAFDAVPSSFNGGWDSDARVCIQIQSPYCATIMALVLQEETSEPSPPPPSPGR